MFECYIWLMASDLPYNHWEPSDPSPEEEKFEEGTYPRVKKKIEEACKNSSVPFDRLHFWQTYGGVAVSAGHSTNHPSGAPDTYRNFLKELARTAPATYGKIYMQDTDRWDSNGEFIVLKLANGVVSETKELLVQPTRRA